MPRHRHAITGYRTSRSACLSLQRARFHPPPRSNVAVAGHPLLRSNGFMRAVGVTTSPLTRLVLGLALRARSRHRVCRLLSELRPRLAQSSAERSDRPAAADGRVCWMGQPRPASVRSICASLGVPAAPRTIAGLVWPTMPDSRVEPARPLRFRGRSAGYATASLRSRRVSFARQARPTPRARHRMPTSLRSQTIQPARVRGHTRRRARPPRPDRSGGRLRTIASVTMLGWEVRLAPARLSLR